MHINISFRDFLWRTWIATLLILVRMSKETFDILLPKFSLAEVFCTIIGQSLPLLAFPFMSSMLYVFNTSSRYYTPTSPLSGHEKSKKVLKKTKKNMRLSLVEALAVQHDEVVDGCSENKTKFRNSSRVAWPSDKYSEPSLII